MTCKGYANGCTCPQCAKRYATHNTTGVSRKEVREFIARELTPLGFRRVGTDQRGHLQFEHPDATGHLVGVPMTPSGTGRWKIRTLTRAKRILRAHNLIPQAAPRDHHSVRLKPVPHALPTRREPTAAEIERCGLAHLRRGIFITDEQARQRLLAPAA